MRSTFALALLLGLGLAGLASADFLRQPATPSSLCALQSPGAPPSLPAAMARRTTLLCNPGYVVLHSAQSRGPLWSAEKLTPHRVAGARATTRAGQFRPDLRLAANERADLADYRRTGYDRGHLSPNGDMLREDVGGDAQAASFLLSNVVPQDPSNNRYLWAAIETAVRDIAAAGTDVYVVTGPLFDGARASAIGAGVLVPTRLWKAVYAPSRGLAGVYIADNAPGDAYRIVSLAQFQSETGIAPFPGARDHFNTARLPPPRQRTQR